MTWCAHGRHNGWICHILFAKNSTVGIAIIYIIVKVNLFWEGRKNLHNLFYGLDIYQVQPLREVSQIFAALSEKLNFTDLLANEVQRQYLIHESLG